jgi:hypothetical protein
MRRLIGVGVGLLLAALTVLLWKQSQVSVAANEIAPGDAIFYFEVPSLVRTVKNFPDTALSQIFQEPSVKRFIRQPASMISKEYGGIWNSFFNLDCTALFFCATDPNGLHWILGFQSSSSSPVRSREIQSISRRLFGRDAVHISLEQQDKVRFTDDANGICFAETGAWTVLSRNSVLLRESLQNAKSGAAGLRSSKLFQECQSKIRAPYDLLLFARGSPSFDLANGAIWEFDREQTPGGAHAVMASTTFEGARLRETIFTSTGTNERYAPLSRQGLAMTSARTIGYLASRLELSQLWRLSDRFSADWPVAAELRDWIGEARSFGIDPEDLDRLVTAGEIVIDRNAVSESLVPAILLEVADHARFQQLIDRIVREKLPDSCRPTSIAGLQAYILSPNENASVVFGLVDQGLLITWDQPVFAEMVRRLRAKDKGLEHNVQFKETESLVAAPSDLFLYVDAKAGFLRLYDASRPMLIFGSALIPVMNRFVDMMALPEGAEIAKHLSPIVLSRHRVANGFIDESAGPVTAYEASAFVIGSAVAAGMLQRK